MKEGFDEWLERPVGSVEGGFLAKEEADLKTEVVETRPTVENQRQRVVALFERKTKAANAVADLVAYTGLTLRELRDAINDLSPYGD